jgi:hypothetical protein
MMGSGVKRSSHPLTKNQRRNASTLPQQEQQKEQQDGNDDRK